MKRESTAKRHVLHARLRVVARTDDNAAIGLAAARFRHDLGMILQYEVHDLALGAGHGLQRDRTSRRNRILGGALGRIPQHGFAAPAVILRINDDRCGVLLATQDDCVDQVLDGIDGVPVFADQEAEIIALDRGDKPALTLTDMNGGVEANATADRLQQLADPVGRGTAGGGQRGGRSPLLRRGPRCSAPLVRRPLKLDTA